MLRLSLHPDGLAPRIANLAQWRTHVLERLHRQAECTADPALASMHEELAALSVPHDRRGGAGGRVAADGGGIFVPLELTVESEVLSFISTTTVFSSSVDVTLAELALESFFPANASTSAWLNARSAERG